MFKVERLLQARQQQIHIWWLPVRTSHRSLQDALVIIPRAFAERVGQHLVDFPTRWKEHRMLGVVRLQHAIEPGIPPRDIVQTPSLIIATEHLAVLAQLRVAVPSDQPAPRMLAQRIHHLARLAQHASLLLYLAFGKCNLKVLADLLQQFPLHIGDALAQSRDLVDAAIALEVRHELDHRL